MTARLAETLRREEQLREAQALAQIGSWTWDLRANEVAWSDELYAIFQVEPADDLTRYRAFLDRVHPDDRAWVERTHEETSVSHEDFVMDYRIVAPDGEVRWLHGRGRVLCDADGEPARLVGTCQDVTERKHSEELLRHQALHDELTGLPTRTLLFDRLEHALSRAQRHGLLMVVLFADLDHFKAVNDRYGHTAGDHALKTIGTELRTALRPGDTVARYGGDEFVAVCEEVVDDAQALHLGRRIVDAVHAATSGFDLGVSASVGIVVNDGCLPAELILRHADAAMYRAKQRGSGQIELFEQVR